jgi:hypothetical protein
VEGQAVEAEVEVVAEAMVEMAVEAVLEEEVTCNNLAGIGETTVVAIMVKGASSAICLKTRTRDKAAVLEHLYHFHEMEVI